MGNIKKIYYKAGIFSCEKTVLQNSHRRLLRATASVEMMIGRSLWIHRLRNWAREPIVCRNISAAAISTYVRSSTGAAGDAAFAYVIAHEVGHHVQNLDGTMERVNRARARMSERDANRLSVMVELQADCLAGVWANRAQARQLFEQGDLEEAFNAAEAVGDDRLQQRSRGYAVPDSFTHGTSAQRLQWFRRGLQSGDPAQCDTFSSL